MAGTEDSKDWYKEPWNEPLPPPRAPNADIDAKLLPHRFEPFIDNDTSALRVPMAEAIITRASEFPMEPIKWLWKGWLAKSKLHIIAGAPEAGKTTIALSLAAAVSSGSYWPDGTRACLGDVLIWSSEDGISDTIIPRLTRMGADLSRVWMVEKEKEPSGKIRPFNPATDLLSLAERAKAIPGGAALLILDPVVAAIPLTRNSHNNAETRNGMQPVVDFAEMIGAAVLGISHFTKGTSGRDPVERVTGSLAFGAIARIVLAASKNGEDETPPRILVRAKSNIGLSGGGFGYDIDSAEIHEQPDVEATRIVWLEAIEGAAQELLNKAENRDEKEKDTKVYQATQFLTDILINGQRLRTEIEEEANNAQIKWKTIDKASGRLGVYKWQEGRKWWWRLVENQK